MLDIKKIKYFITILSENGYTAASRKLYISQPSLSKAIKSLENEIGYQLFTPNRKHIELTEHGRKFYEMSIPIIENYEEFMDSVFEEAEKTTGILSIGIPPIIGTCALSAILSNYITHYPEVSLQICQKPANTIQNLVREKSLDVGFVILPLIPNEFNVISIDKDKNAVVLPENHVLARKKSIGIEELKLEKFIMLDNEYTLNSNFISACHEHDFEPNIILEVSHWDLVLQLVKSNAGISILPRKLFDFFSTAGIQLVELAHASNRWDVVMITKKNYYHNIIVSSFVSFIKKYIDKNTTPQEGFYN